AGQRCAISSQSSSDVNMLCIILDKNSPICNRKSTTILIDYFHSFCLLESFRFHRHGYLTSWRHSSIFR
ncbi:hypothetical protein GCK32_019273, partial [Trichostrongylus colubriformis]